MKKSILFLTLLFTFVNGYSQVERIEDNGTPYYLITEDYLRNTLKVSTILDESLVAVQRYKTIAEKNNELVDALVVEREGQSSIIAVQAEQIGKETQLNENLQQQIAVLKKDNLKQRRVSRVLAYTTGLLGSYTILTIVK